MVTVKLNSMAREASRRRAIMVRSMRKDSSDFLYRGKLSYLMEKGKLKLKKDDDDVTLRN